MGPCTGGQENPGTPDRWFPEQLPDPSQPRRPWTRTNSKALAVPKAPKLFASLFKPGSRELFPVLR